MLARHMAVGRMASGCSCKHAKINDLMVWFNRTPADFGQHTIVTIVLFNV
jgi:hypothetical protein